MGTRSGNVVLPAVPGASATVEAAWIPVTDGQLPVPELRLRNFPSQEVFDAGQATFIWVVPPLVDVELST